MPTKGIRVQRDPAIPTVFEELTVGAITPAVPATDLTPTGPLGVFVGTIHENTGNIPVRYRVDDGSPTTTSGHRLMPGAAEYMNEHEMRRVQYIAESGETTITMTHYRE